jgi:hypothetical protein
MSNTGAPANRYREIHDPDREIVSLSASRQDWALLASGCFFEKQPLEDRLWC